MKIYGFDFNYAPYRSYGIKSQHQAEKLLTQAIELKVDKTTRATGPKDDQEASSEGATKAFFQLGGLNEIPGFKTGASCSIIPQQEDSPILRIEGLETGARAEYLIGHIPPTQSEKQSSNFLRWMRSQIGRVGRIKEPKVTKQAPLINEVPDKPFKLGRLTLTKKGKFAFSRLDCLKGLEASIIDQDDSSVTLKANRDYNVKLALIKSPKSDGFDLQVTVLDNDDNSPSSEFEQALYTVQISAKAGAKPAEKKVVHILQDKLLALLQEDSDRPIELHAVKQ